MKRVQVNEALIKSEDARMVVILLVLFGAGASVSLVRGTRKQNNACGKECDRTKSYLKLCRC